MKFPAYFFLILNKSALQFLTEARNESFNSRKLNSVDTIDATALELFDCNSLNFLRNEFSNIPVMQKQQSGLNSTAIIMKKLCWENG